MALLCFRVRGLQYINFQADPDERPHSLEYSLNLKLSINVKLFHQQV